jgi:hypothetical protein
MRRPGSRHAAIVLATAVMLIAPGASLAQEPGRAAVATTAHFVFYQEPASLKSRPLLCGVANASYPTLRLSLTLFTRSVAFAIATARVLPAAVFTVPFSVTAPLATSISMSLSSSALSVRY